MPGFGFARNLWSEIQRARRRGDRHFNKDYNWAAEQYQRWRQAAVGEARHIGNLRRQKEVLSRIRPRDEQERRAIASAQRGINEWVKNLVEWSGPLARNEAAKWQDIAKGNLASRRIPKRISFNVGGRRFNYSGGRAAVALRTFEASAQRALRSFGRLRGQGSGYNPIPPTGKTQKTLAIVDTLQKQYGWRRGANRTFLARKGYNYLNSILQQYQKKDKNKDRDNRNRRNRYWDRRRRRWVYRTGNNNDNNRSRDRKQRYWDRKRRRWVYKTGNNNNDNNKRERYWDRRRRRWVYKSKSRGGGKRYWDRRRRRWVYGSRKRRRWDRRRRRWVYT